MEKRRQIIDELVYISRHIPYFIDTKKTNHYEVFINIQLIIDRLILLIQDEILDIYILVESDNYIRELVDWITELADLDKTLKVCSWTHLLEIHSSLMQKLIEAELYEAACNIREIKTLAI